MNEKKALRKAMEVRGINQTLLAKKAGFKHQSNISGMLGGKSMRVDNLIMLLDLMDFDLIVKDRNGQNRDNIWKIENDAE